MDNRITSMLSDWYRPLHIDPQPEVLKRRWDAAAKLLDAESSERVTLILGNFSEDSLREQDASELSDALMNIDATFPQKNNGRELAVIAGVAVQAALELDSPLAIPLALGLNALTYPGRKWDPLQGEICSNTRRYLAEKSSAIRVNHFGVQTGDEGDSEDPSQLRESMHELSEQVRRLSEEVALSWWILNQYSDLLQKPLSQVNLLSYVLAAAAEAAARTTILPPALSMPALIAKSLKGCKQSRVKDIALLALFQESDSVSVVLEQHPMDHGEPTRILLVSSILGRIREFNDASLAVSTTTRFFPGTKSDMQVAPSRVATQYYDELVFLSSLSQLHGEV